MAIKERASVECCSETCENNVIKAEVREGATPLGLVVLRET